MEKNSKDGSQSDSKGEDEYKTSKKSEEPNSTHENQAIPTRQLPNRTTRGKR